MQPGDVLSTTLLRVGPVLSYLSAVAGLEILDDVALILCFVSQVQCGKTEHVHVQGTTRNLHAHCSLLSHLHMVFTVPHEHRILMY